MKDDMEPEFRDRLIMFLPYYADEVVIVVSQHDEGIPELWCYQIMDYECCLIVYCL